MRYRGRSTVSSPRPVREGVATGQLRQLKMQAPLAQSAERLHGKNPARNGVLTCRYADESLALCSELDALSLSQKDLASVTQVTCLKA